MPRDRTQDPYAPPPRHKDSSGAVVRVVLIAAMLGLAVWGYTEFSDQSAPSLVTENQQQVADAGINPDGSYEVTPAPATTAPAPAAPAQPEAESNQSQPSSAPARAPSTPPPSTTIGTPGR